ncbi:MAG TPA: FG-GAP-like repeat-containing protein, partial [Vicinamibacterales bacterium]|nr:FG-GAP-like repeat-containing protein [Vicinamibacterales bacterium]
MPGMAGTRILMGLGLAIGLCFASWELGVGGSRLTAAQLQQATEQPITFRIIVVSTADRAAALAAQVTQGADFAQLAKAESLDPSASQGGLIGPIALTELRSELQAALRPLSVGAVSGVLRLPTGFAIVQRVQSATSASRVRGNEILALSTTSEVRASLSVDGFSEAGTALNNFEKPADWNQDALRICEYRQQAIDKVNTALSRVLAPEAEKLRAPFTPNEVMEGHLSLGQIHAYMGNMDRSIAQFEQAFKLAQVNNPAALSDLEQMLGIAYIHKAEMDNGIYREPGDRCLLATKAGASLAKTDAFDEGVRHITALLDKRPGDVELKWFLNAAFMATGGYPNRVPPRYAIPPDAMASGENVGRFVDVSAQAGINSFSSAGGVIVDDFDNDGRLDLLTSNFDSCGRMQLFHRREDGSFEDRAMQAGLGNQLGGLNLSQADYNNDGCKDILVMRGGWELAQRRSLLRNNCDGTFTDVTAAAGLLTPVTSSQTAAWTDIDNDGWIDLFVGNEDAPLQLFRNRGDGTFDDIAAAAGVKRSFFTKAVAAGDYDNDGFPDLYVSNFRDGNVLFHNNGDRTFRDVTRVAGVPGADRGFPAWFFDYDNDGWDDIFASSYYLSIEEIGRSYLKLPLNATTMKLYRNAGDGSFLDVTGAANLEKVLMPMGSNFGDIDNDGFLDIYLGTGSPSYVSLAPSMLLRNKNGASFVDVTVASGTGEMHKGHGVAFADLDNDGDEDIVFKVGGATPGDAHAFRLFENPGSGNDWLGIHLVGVRTNRAAIGARIKVTVENTGGGRRSMYRTVNSGGSFGASPLEQHIGLGKAARVAEVEIKWPASGTRQVFT